MIRAMSRLTGQEYRVSAVVVSELCLVASLMLIWWMLGMRVNPQTVSVMAVAAVFPGSIYFHTVFPTSMCLLGLVGVLLGIQRESWAIAGLGAFVAFSTHIVGVIGVVIVAASVFVGWRRYSWPGRAVRAGSAALTGLLALPLALGLIHADTGSWTIYWEHQREAFGNGDLRNPVAAIGLFWSTPFSEWYPSGPDSTWLVLHSAAAHQSQLVINIGFAAVLLGTTLHRLRKGDIAAWETVAALAGLTAFGIPLLTGAVTAWYRHNALMLVALPVLRMPRFIWACAFVLCLAQAVLLGAMWFSGSLV